MSAQNGDSGAARQVPDAARPVHPALWEGAIQARE